MIVAGGDGTVNEAARELVNTQLSLVSSLRVGQRTCKDLGIPIDTEKALDMSCEEHTRSIDYGTANGHIFFVPVGSGLMHLLAIGSLMSVREVRWVMLETCWKA